MIRHSRIVITITATAAVLVSPLTGQGQTVPTRSAGSREVAVGPRGAARPSLESSSIRGVVLDEQGRALPQVRVRVLGPATVAQTTGPQGVFHFSSLPAGLYLVRAYAAGYYAAMSGQLAVAGGVAPALRLTLVELPDEGAPVDDGDDGDDGSEPARKPLEPLAAGFGLPAPLDLQPGRPGGGLDESSGEPGEPGEPEDARANTGAGDGGDGGDGNDGGEFVWRLRRLARSPLKDDRTGARLGGPDGRTFVPEAVTAIERALGTSVRMASSVFDESLSGEVNLLASGAFDSPQDLFSADPFSHNVTYASVGAAAGDLGTWAVRGALTQGDVSSWILAGFLVAPETSRHVYDVGMSYSTQRYTGGNAAALAAVSDGARNATEIYAFDQWRVSPRLSLGYGGRYSNYDYLDEGGLLSPRVSATVTPIEHLRVHLLAARRTVAPGAEEFVPGVSAGLWLPPERTFSPLIARRGFSAERNTHYEVGVERDLNSEFLVAFRAYEQDVTDQLATLFDVRSASGSGADLGHYYVATAGNVRTRGWAASVSHEIGTVRSTVEYAQSSGVWDAEGTAADVARIAGAAVRRGTEELVDVTTSVRAAIPQTSTRLFVLYRLSNGFARIEDVRTGARFNVQINQALPFMNFNSAEWEMMIDVRNLFRDPVADASLYDELLVVNPPKRFVGGILVRF